MLKRVQSSDQVMNLMQDNVDTELSKLQNEPMSGGVMLTDVSLTSGVDNLIQHGLGREVQFFIVSYIGVDTRIWSPATASLNNKNSSATVINLWCSTSCTADIWVN